jgi:hypothetical protein
MNHEEIEKQNRPIINNEIKLVIKFSIKKSPEMDGFTDELYHIFKELTSVPSNHSKKWKGNGILP